MSCCFPCSSSNSSIPLAPPTYSGFFTCHGVQLVFLTWLAGLSIVLFRDPNYSDAPTSSTDCYNAGTLVPLRQTLGCTRGVVLRGCLCCGIIGLIYPTLSMSLSMSELGLFNFHQIVVDFD